MADKPIVLRRTGTIVAPRDPIGGVNVHPDSRLAHKTPDTPQIEHPHPFLQAHGFSGSVASFNTRVKNAHEGYTQAYGKEPSPGTIWDVVKHPKLMDGQIQSMFQVPLDQRATKANEFHWENTWNGQGIHLHPGSKWAERATPLTAFETKMAHENPKVLAADKPNGVMSAKEFHKKYPWVSSNFVHFLPGYQAIGNFWNDVLVADAHPNKINEKISGLSLDQLTKMYGSSGLAGEAAINQEGMQRNIAQQMQAQQQSGQPGKVNPNEFQTKEQQQLSNQEQAKVTGAVQGARARLKTVQEFLLAHDPAGLFKDLKPGGIMDSNWMTQYSKWRRTPGAAALMLQTMAKDNEYDTTPKGIETMIRALHTKQEYVDSKKNLADKWIAQATPLRFFDKGSATTPMDFFRSYGHGDIAKYSAQSLKNMFNYETNGWSYNVPQDLLTGVFRTAGLAFDTLNGVWGEGTAWGTALTNQVKTVIDGAIHQNLSYKQISAGVAKALEENPSITRAIGFGYLPANQASDIILNLIASVAIRGPGYFKFDEGTALAKIRRNPWTYLITKVGYNSLRGGDLAAAEHILGGSEARPFLVSVFDDVASKNMTHGEFHDLITEKFKTGKVQLPAKSTLPTEEHLATNPGDRFVPITYKGLPAWKGLPAVKGPGDIVIGKPGEGHAGLEKGGVQGYAVVENGKVARVNFSHPGKGTDLKELGSFMDQYDRNPEIQKAIKDAVESKFSKTVVQTRGSVLYQLRSKVEPKHASVAAIKLGTQRLNEIADNLEQRSLLYGGKLGNGLEAMSRSIRGQFRPATAAHITSAPLKVESFLVNNGLMSDKEAKTVVNRLIIASTKAPRFREQELAQIRSELIAKFDEKFPKDKNIIKPSGTELPSRTGRYRGKVVEEPKPGIADKLNEIVGAPGESAGIVKIEVNRIVSGGSHTDSLLNLLNAFNDEWLNTPGAYWRKTMVAEGPGLTWKHGFRDTFAAKFAGAKYLKADLFNNPEIKALYDSHPELRQALDQFRGQTVMSETLYMDEGNFHITDQPDWRLSDRISSDKGNADTYAQAAAKFLTDQVNSHYYQAYRTYKETGNMEALTNAIKTTPALRHELNQVTGLAKEMVRAKNKVAAQFPESPKLGNFAARTTFNKVAAEYAKMIASRLDSIQQEGRDAHIHDLLGETYKLSSKSPGVADVPGAFPQLAKLHPRIDDSLSRFLIHNDVNLSVPKGTVRTENWLNRKTGNAIRKYMFPNRLARAKTFDTLFQKYFESMRADGYAPEQAFMGAANAAKHTTMFHLLDYSNMIYFEQKFRGAFPFLTKHRLFAKWALGRIWQHPYAVVPLQEIRQHLDKYGRLDFHIDGLAVNLNLMRLSFLNSADLPYVLPGGALIPGIRGTSLAAPFTRFDAIAKVWYTVAKHGWNYEALRKDLDPFTMNRIDRYMAVYAINARLHNLSANVNQTEALKYALIRASSGGIPGGVMRDIIINSSFISPITISEPDVPKHVADLNKQYDQLLATNPNAASDFLNKHPEVSLSWGIHQDFEVYNHVSQFWGLYDKALAKYTAAENHVLSAFNGGQTDPKAVEEYSKAKAEFYAKIQQLKLADAKQWKAVVGNGPPIGGFAAGSYSNDGREITTPGPWYIQYSHNAAGAAEMLKNDFGLQKKDLGDVYGYQTGTINDLLNYPGLDAATKSMLFNQLDRTRAAQKMYKENTIQKFSADYSNFLGKVFKSTSGQDPVVRAQTDWKKRNLIIDNYLHPTKVNGHTTMPFMEWYYLNLSPQERAAKIFGQKGSFGMLGRSFSSLTFDEKKLLGIQTTPEIDKGWGVFNYWTASYSDQTGKTASTSVRQEYVAAIDKSYPGFAKEYKQSHWPRAFYLLYYAKGAFAQSNYSSYWKEIALKAAQVYNANKYQWNSDAAYYDKYIRDHWPRGFVQEYVSAGGVTFLKSLATPWG